MNTAQCYRDFASEARAESPSYERLAVAVAGDDELLRLLDQLPAPKRQPNLLDTTTRLWARPTVPCCSTAS